MAAVPSDFDPNKAENLEDIEKQFAVVAVEYAETYWTLLEKIGGRNLRLTPIDDEIYADLLETFPEFQQGVEAGKCIDENVMKSKLGKDKWNKFASRYEKRVNDFNFGSLLRIRSDEGLTHDNTIFSFRVQTMAIEIFRNRHGLNDWVYKGNK